MELNPACILRYAEHGAGLKGSIGVAFACVVERLAVAYTADAAAVVDDGGDIQQQPADQLEGSDLAAAGSCAECVAPLDSSTALSAVSRETSSVVVFAAYCTTSGTYFCFCCFCPLFLLVGSFQQRVVAVSISAGKLRLACLPFVYRRFSVAPSSPLHPAWGMSSAVGSGLGMGPWVERLAMSPIPPSFPLASTSIAELVKSSFLQ